MLRIALAQKNSAFPPGATFRDGPNFPEMIVVPSGTFMMGASDHEYEHEISQLGFMLRRIARESEGYALPQHRVTLPKDFGMSRYDVTRGEFATFVKETGYRAKHTCTIEVGHRIGFSFGASWRNPGFVQTDRDPVVCVRWQDAQAYIAWLNKQIAENLDQKAKGFYRLPTEAEWEYSARGGTTTARWWGNAIGTENANCDGCSPTNLRKTTPVGSFKANPFGLYDVLGNVLQWTSDCWHSEYIGAPSDGSSWSDYSCSDSHVIRGGSWVSSTWFVRSATRTYPGPGKYTSYTGFRVAKQIE
jgi:formylglycine-generating enzyme required for sulfatase activity